MMTPDQIMSIVDKELIAISKFARNVLEKQGVRKVDTAMLARHILSHADSTEGKTSEFRSLSKNLIRAYVDFWCIRWAYKEKQRKKGAAPVPAKKIYTALRSGTNGTTSGFSGYWTSDWSTSTTTNRF